MLFCFLLIFFVNWFDVLFFCFYDLINPNPILGQSHMQSLHNIKICQTPAWYPVEFITVHDDHVRALAPSREPFSAMHSVDLQNNQVSAMASHSHLPISEHRWYRYRFNAIHVAYYLHATPHNSIWCQKSNTRLVVRFVIQNIRRAHWKL